MKITAVVTGVGIPMMEACLKTMRPFPDQVVVVLDDVGRYYSNIVESAEAYEARLKLRFPEVEIVHNRNYDNWQITNQTINIGIAAARNEWVAIIHEDTVWPDADHFAELSHSLSRISDLEAASGRRFAGIVFPMWQMTDVPDGEEKAPVFAIPGDCIVQTVAPTTIAFRKGLWEEFGRFDEDVGVWYDAQLQAEIIKRDLWLYYRDLPPVQHWPSSSYRSNNWGNGWVFAERWGNFPVAYEKMYGGMFTRKSNPVAMPEGWEA